MKPVLFNLDSLNISELLSNDEMVSINAGAFIDMPKGIFEGAPTAPGYTEATIIWSQIP